MQFYMKTIILLYAFEGRSHHLAERTWLHGKGPQPLAPLSKPREPIWLKLHGDSHENNCVFFCLSCFSLGFIRHAEARSLCEVRCANALPVSPFVHYVVVRVQRIEELMDWLLLIQ